MTRRDGLTVADRELILRLRVEIKAAGLNMTRVAERIGCPAHKVRAQLSGQRGMSVDDVKLILTSCGWPQERQDALFQIGESTDTRNVLWLEPEEVCTSLIAYSRDVTRAVHVAPTMLPWPVHNDAYAWRVALKTGASPKLLDRWALVRTVWTWRWQLEDPRATAVVFLHEDVLRTLIDVAMVRQLHKLVQMADFPGLSLRIIPTGAGLHAAIKGPFTLLQFVKWEPLVYQECGNAALVAGTQGAIRDAQRIVSLLHATTLDEKLSREMIGKMWRSIRAAKKSS
jgi:hypothetical protein